MPGGVGRVYGSRRAKWPATAPTPRFSLEDVDIRIKHWSVTPAKMRMVALSQLKLVGSDGVPTKEAKGTKYRTSHINAVISKTGDVRIPHIMTIEEEGASTAI